VVNLRGEVVGVMLARVDRTRSFMIPAAAVKAVMAGEAVDPAVAKVGFEEAEVPARLAGGGQPPRARPQGRAMRGNEDRLRRHLSDMDRLMERMREEMRDLDGVAP
jgi:hypothetical protein